MVEHPAIIVASGNTAIRLARRAPCSALIPDSTELGARELFSSKCAGTHAPTAILDVSARALAMLNARSVPDLNWQSVHDVEVAAATLVTHGWLSLEELFGCAHVVRR
jgi:hypothetical protein